jgi:3-mercaptopyruvate sulfurtransferase SseA
MLLKWHGYKNLELLDGHMMRWRQAGRLLQRDQYQPVNELIKAGSEQGRQGRGRTKLSF